MSAKIINLNKSFLKEVAARVGELMVEELEADKTATLEGYTPSEKFTKSMQEMLEKPVKKRMPRSLKTIFVIAAILIMLFACAMGVSAIRKAIFNFFVSFCDDHAVIVYEASEVSADSAYSGAPTEIEIYYEPTYIPEGYEKESLHSDNICYEVRYSDGVYYYLFTQDLLSTVTVVDSEEKIFENVEINGTIGFYSDDSNASERYLIWSDDTYTYTISSNSPDIKLNEIVKIAESISPLK